MLCTENRKGGWAKNYPGDASTHCRIPPYGVDHEDCNGLNNQRYNLRPANQTQNLAHARVRVGMTSPYKGVSYCKRTKKWVAQICAHGVHKFLGRFNKEYDAAQAYNFAAEELFGEFARLNRAA